jgi:uroporphyrinogen-III synthase
MKTAYLGLDPTRFSCEGELIHLPLIRIVPKDFESKEIQSALSQLPHFTHTLFTSRTSISLWRAHLEKAALSLPTHTYFVIGNATAQLLSLPSLLAPEPTSEGVITLLKEENWQNAYLFYPKSEISRPLIENYLHQAQIPHHPLSLYTTQLNPIPLPDLSSFDRFIFTSPSTVHAFVALAKRLPPIEKCHAIGPVTQDALLKIYSSLGT